MIKAIKISDTSPPLATFKSDEDYHDDQDYYDSDTTLLHHDPRTTCLTSPI
jgi:hypothetical protein